MGMTPTKRTVTAELDSIARLAAGLPVERTEDSITISDTTLGRRYIFYVRPGTRGIRITCWESRGHLIGRDRKHLVRRTLRDGYSRVAGLVRYARYEAERMQTEAAAQVVETPAANTVTTITADDFEARLTAATIPGVTPRIVEVKIDAALNSDRRPCFAVTPVWDAEGGLDRPAPNSWHVDNLSDGRRLRAAVLAGAVYGPPVVRRDTAGNTYPCAESKVLGKTLGSDLLRLGY